MRRVGASAFRQALARASLRPEVGVAVDFTQPAGEPALAPHDGVAWQVFRNPVALFVGGVTAVILELAEPRVRSGIWDHTSFRTDPLSRMERTGLAAMVTVYGARSVAEKMIAGVSRMHARVSGTTPDGVAYRADDPELLDWVHATANFGFLEAYCTFVRPALPRRSRSLLRGRHRGSAALRRHGRADVGCRAGETLRGDAPRAGALADRVRVPRDPAPHADLPGTAARRSRRC